MLVSHRSSTVARSPSFSGGAVLASLLAGLIVVGSSCSSGDDEALDDLRGTSLRGSAGIPTLDVRGGTVNSEVAPGIRTVTDGNGGRGGAIQITSENGSVAVETGAPVDPAPVGTFDPVAPPPAVQALDVLPGQEVIVAGSYQVAWLRVQAGGTLRLAGGTVFRVAGDVEVAGTVFGERDEDSIQGKSLSIYAQGTVAILGVIDCSGFSEDNTNAARPDLYPGGDGGEVYIGSSTGQVFLATGAAILADGGPTYSRGGAYAMAGEGGKVTLDSTTGTITVAGRVSARGGKGYTVKDGFEGNGGTIELSANGNVSLFNVLELNANGGSSSGAGAGDGGIVSFTAASGSVRLASFAIQARGGAATFYQSAQGGEGGQVLTSSSTVQASDVEVDASGGSSVQPSGGPTDSPLEGGVGGSGGVIELVAAGSMQLGDPAPLLAVHLLATGGATYSRGSDGGSGGEIRLLTTGLTFAGTALVTGGASQTGLPGDDGSICADGASDDVLIVLRGASGVDVGPCTAGP